MANAAIEPLTGAGTSLGFQATKDGAKKMLARFLTGQNLSLDNLQDHSRIGTRDCMELWSGYIHQAQHGQADKKKYYSFNTGSVSHSNLSLSLSSSTNNSSLLLSFSPSLLLSFSPSITSFSPSLLLSFSPSLLLFFSSSLLLFLRHS